MDKTDMPENQEGLGDEDSNVNGVENDPAYLVIDYGEQLLRDLEDTRNEIQKESASIKERLNRLWAVQVNFMVVTVPVLLGMFATIVVSLFLPTGLSTWIGTIFMSLTLGLLFLTATPFLEALSRYQEHELYNAYFRSCECLRCDTRRDQGQSAATTSQNVNNHVIANEGESNRVGSQNKVDSDLEVD